MLIVFGIPVLLFLIYSIYIGLIDSNLFSQFISSAFSSDETYFSNIRRGQAVALAEGWLDSPFFGKGPGVNASVVQSYIPGAYELSYLALLFSRGIIGFSIYIIQILLLIYWGIKLSKKANSKLKPIIISYNVAFVSFLISNASNPYLDAYDHMWVIFLYIGLQNVLLKQQEYEQNNLCINKSI